MRRALVLALSVCLALPACRAQPHEVEGTQAVVLAASGSAAAIEQAAIAAGVPVAVSGAGSQVLAAQVRAGAPVDLLVLADLDLALSLVAEGLSEPQALMHTGLSVVGRPGLAVSSVREALADPELTVVLADEGVPLGDATQAALELVELSLDPARVVSLEDSAASVLAKVASGSADLAVVFTANARLAASEGRAVNLGNLGSDDFAVTTWLQWATPRGRDVASALTGAEARRSLAESGFDVN